MRPEQSDLATTAVGVRIVGDEFVPAAAATGGISSATWRMVETRGEPVRKSTLAVDRALGWPFGRANSILDGEDPPPASPAAQKPPLELAALSGKLDQLSDRDRRLIENMIDEMLEDD